jgi:hypothetical protein
MDAALARAFRELRERKGPCPDSDASASYFAGDLSPSEADRIRQHIECCGECDLILERMKVFEKAVPGPPRWKATERRIAARLGLPEPQAGIVDRLASAVRHPLFAYALAVALIYPAYLGLSVKPQPSAPPAELAPPSLKPARSFDLSQTRGASSEIRLAEGEGTFILFFFIPARSGFDYFAAVKGVRMPLAAPDSAGNLYLVCDRRLFPQGEYRLKVTEVDRQTGQAREFPAFSFTVN